MGKRPRTTTTTAAASAGGGGGGQVIVVLAKASLETGRVGATTRDTPYQLLNGDEHHAFITKKLKRDPADYRPDITHQALLALLDSPLNKAGRLRVYVHTQRNVLIEVHPRIRLPRTFKRFCGLMAHLLHKLKVRATSDSSAPLLRVIANPVASHLPVGSRKVLLTYNCERLRDVRQVAAEDVADEGESVVFVVGAMAHGKVACEWTEEEMSLSRYPCSAAVICGRVCNAFEGKWDVL